MHKTMLSEKLAAMQPHVLVTGHSGAGKSTTASQLSQQLSMPVYSIDSRPEWGDLFRSDPDDEHLVPGTAKRKEFIQLRRRLARESLAGLTRPTIIEGTQLAGLTNRELADYPNRVMVTTPLKELLRQRLERVRAKALAKGKPWNDEIAAKRQSAGRRIYDDNAKVFRRVSKVPGTVQHNSRSDVQELIAKLQLPKLAAVVSIIRGNPDADPDNAAKYENFYSTVADIVRQQGATAKFDSGLSGTVPDGDIWLGHSRGADRLRFAPSSVKTLRLDDFEPATARASQEADFNRLFKQYGYKTIAEVPIEMRPKPGPEHYTLSPKAKSAIVNLLQQVSTKRAASPSIIAAGLCILAEDTGRVLMLQRSFKETDAAAGKWEFPGGHLEDGESPLEGARREFEEEVGHRLPALVSVRADYVEGIYQLFVATVPEETAIKINRPLDRRVRNPDGDEVETVAWWQPKDLENNKSIRAELARVVSSKLKWTIRLAKLRARRMEKTAAGYLEQAQSAMSSAVGGIDTKIRQLAQRISSDPAKARSIRAAIYGGGAGTLMGAMDDPGYDENGNRRSRLGNMVGQGLAGASIGGVASKLGGVDAASLRTRVGLLRFEQKFASVRRAETAQTLAADIVSRMTAKTAEGGLKETISKMLGDASTWAGKKFDQAKSVAQPSALQSAVDRIKGWADDPDKRLMLTSLIGAGVGGATMVGAEAMNSQKRKKRYLNALLTGAAGGGLTGLGGGLLYNASTGDLSKQYNRAFGDAAKSDEQTALLDEARKQAPTRGQVEAETARQQMDNIAPGGTGAAVAGAGIGAAVGGGVAGKQSLRGDTHTERSLNRSNEMRNIDANKQLALSQLRAKQTTHAQQLGAFNSDANAYSALARAKLTGPNLTYMGLQRAMAPNGYLEGRPVDAKLLKTVQRMAGTPLETTATKALRDSLLNPGELAGLQGFTKRLSEHNRANPTAPFKSFDEAQAALRPSFDVNAHEQAVRAAHDTHNKTRDAMRLDLKGNTRRATYSSPLDKFLYGGPKRRGFNKTLGRTIGGALLGGILGEGADQVAQYYTGGLATSDFNKQNPNLYRDDL